MISIEELRESLRLQLSALIAAYEDDPALLDVSTHGGEGTRESVGDAPSAVRPAPSGTQDDGGAPCTEPALEDDDPHPPLGDAERALEIEICLTAFDAAIRAAERAELARADVQRAAHAAIDRVAPARAAATGLRQELQRMLLATGRVAIFDGDVEPRRIVELRAALRLADNAARHADREAQQARRRAEIAIAAASAALLAAIQADPSRGNPALDPAVARSALAVAERAAEQAESSREAAELRTEAVVIAFDRAGLGSGHGSRSE